MGFNLKNINGLKNLNNIKNPIKTKKSFYISIGLFFITLMAIAYIVIVLMKLKYNCKNKDSKKTKLNMPELNMPETNENSIVLDENVVLGDANTQSNSLASLSNNNNNKNNGNSVLPLNESQPDSYKNLDSNNSNELYTNDEEMFDASDKEKVNAPKINSKKRRVNFYAK